MPVVGDESCLPLSIRLKNTTENVSAFSDKFLVDILFTSSFAFLMSHAYFLFFCLSFSTATCHSKILVLDFRSSKDNIAINILLFCEFFNHFLLDYIFFVTTFFFHAFLTSFSLNMLDMSISIHLTLFFVYVSLSHSFSLSFCSFFRVSILNMCMCVMT